MVRILTNYGLSEDILREIEVVLDSFEDGRIAGAWGVTGSDKVLFSYIRSDENRSDVEIDAVFDVNGIDVDVAHVHRVNQGK